MSVYVFSVFDPMHTCRYYTNNDTEQSVYVKTDEDGETYYEDEDGDVLDEAPEDFPVEDGDANNGDEGKDASVEESPKSFSDSLKAIYLDKYTKLMKAEGYVELMDLVEAEEEDLNDLFKKLKLLKPEKKRLQKFILSETPEAKAWTGPHEDDEGDEYAFTCRWLWLAYLLTAV